MSVSCWLTLCCVTCVTCVTGAELGLVETTARAGSKDMLYPVLLGVVAKVVSVIPVVLTSLAVVVGFSLAVSKMALLLGGVLVFYHYLSEGHLTVGSKKWKNLMTDWGADLGHLGYHPQAGGYPGLGYDRDRNDRRLELQLPD